MADILQHDMYRPAFYEGGRMNKSFQPHGGRPPPQQQQEQEEHHHDEDHPQQPPPKRRRVAVACHACRIRKARCDGVRPKCTSCVDFDEDCIYQEPSGFRRGRNIDLQNSKNSRKIEERLQALEEQLIATRRAQSITEQREQFSPLASTSLSSMDERFSVEETSTGSSVVTASETPMHDVDGMGTIELTDEQVEHEFFGPSSNISLIKRVSHALVSTVSKRNSSHPQHGDIGVAGSASGTRSGVVRISTTGHRPKLRAKASQPLDIFTLPPESEMRALIRHYFSTVGLVYPFLHEENFVQFYNQARRDDRMKFRRSLLGILNLIFALASITLNATSPRENRATEADIYYKRAVGLCGKILLRGTSLETVQLLVMMVGYLQGTSNSSETWSTHGLAVKTALQLGLYSMEASESLPTLEREMRKRTWFCLVNFDRTLSITFGRPAFIPNAFVKLERAVCVNGDLPSPHNSAFLSSISISYLNAYTTLCGFSLDIVEQLFNHNLSESQPLSMYELLSKRFDLCWRLSEWQSKLPSEFQIIKSSEVPFEDGICSLETTIFRVSLSLRYFHTRILIGRPILTKLLEHNSNSGMSEFEISVLKENVSLALVDCARCCEDLITLTGSVLSTSKKGRNVNGAWWLSCYFSFNAALVIFGILLACSEGAHEMPPGMIISMRENLSRTVEVMQDLDGGNEVIARCRSYLMRLLEIYDSLDAEPINPPDASPTTSIRANPSLLHEYWGIADPLLMGSKTTSSFSNSIEFGGLVTASDIEFLNQGLGVEEIPFEW